MKSRTARRGIALLAAVVLTLSLAPAALAHGPKPAPKEAEKPHCASLLSTPNNGKDAKIQKTRCFEELAPALRYAVKGAEVPDDVLPEDLDDALLSPTSKVAGSDRTTIIGIHWEHVDRGGRDRIYFVKGAQPCASGRAWQIGKLDAGWEKLVSSAESFGGCGAFTQFAKPKLSGSAVVCSPYCAGLGSLNDRVHSIRWSA